MAFASNVKSDDTNGAEQFFGRYNKQQTGYWNRNWSRRLTRSVGADETDTAPKDIDAAEQYYPYYSYPYPAMNGYLGINGVTINGPNGYRLARSIAAEETDVTPKDTDAADQYLTYWNGRWIASCSHQGRRWTRGLRCDSSGVHH